MDSKSLRYSIWGGRRLDSDPGYIRGRRNLAVALNQSGDAPQALEEYRALLKVQTTDPLLYLEYADTLRATDQKADAVKAYQQALGLLPLTSDQSETRARIENQLKQLTQYRSGPPPQALQQSTPQRRLTTASGEVSKTFFRKDALRLDLVLNQMPGANGALVAL